MTKKVNIDDWFQDFKDPLKEQKTIPANEESMNLHSEEQTNIHTEVQTNEHINTQSDIQTNDRLKLYLNVYIFKSTKEQISKGKFKPTNVEISEEIRMAMDKLIRIYLDGVVANDTDKTYKDIVNNALFEYLSKKFKQLQNAN